MYSTNERQKIHLYQIAVDMMHCGYDYTLIIGAVELASEYEGAYDLMAMWTAEDDQGEKKLIIKDIKKLIEEIRDLE